MQGRWQRIMRIGGQVALPVLLVGVRVASAGGLGIASLDTFLSTMVTGVTGVSLAVGIAGLVGYVGSLMDNPFATVLQGSISFFTKAGILGGGATMLGAIGLTGGATL